MRDRKTEDFVTATEAKLRRPPRALAGLELGHLLLGPEHQLVLAVLSIQEDTG